MNGEANYIIKYMQGTEKRFIIPVYQRNYDWRIEQCKQLFDDLVKVIKNDRESHFFGSIVSTNNPEGGHSELLIIDGQQRITTISILMLAMYRLLTKGEVVPKNLKLAKIIYEEYLIDRFKIENESIKLKPIKNDSFAYQKLFGDMDEFQKDSNITTNYFYFVGRIRGKEITIDDLYMAITRLKIIDISLKAEDNPQLIFESLNSTGLDLTEGDKIRNYILMGLSVKDQEIYYSKYWNPIEEKTDYDVSGFIRDYLSVKRMETPAISKVYKKFKEYVEIVNCSTEELLSDLLIYAKRYKILLHGKKENDRIDASINRLNKLKTTVIRPFLLETLREKEEGHISVQDLEKIIETVENYSFRRNICDLPTNSLSKIFLQLHKEIVRLEKNSELYLEKMKYLLLNKKEKARFPSDEEFLERLVQKNIYSMSSKNKWYIFERFENGNSKETKNIYKMLEEGEYSIEHIMPQHLTPIWKQELGSECEEIHEKWLHRIANLTLTAYNSKYSNRPFEVKRDMQYGFKESGFKMNQKIATKAQWGLSELKDREEDLKQNARELWPSLKSIYLPKEKPLDIYALDDDFTFTGRILTKFQFMGSEQPANSWVDMYQKVLTMLHQENKTILNHLADCGQEEAELADHVGRSLEFVPCSCRIDEDIYIVTRTSTQYKISLLKRFFALFEVDESELIFYLQDEEESEDKKNLIGIDQLRIEFWRKALPIIQEQTDCFKNANPTKSNWIGETTGVGEIIYAVIANVDGIRTELHIGTSNKYENKQVYDKLFAKKDEIESDFGKKLQWTRMNDNISSRIFVVEDNLSISNENDWDEIAKFFAVNIKNLKYAMQEKIDAI